MPSTMTLVVLGNGGEVVKCLRIVRMLSIALRNFVRIRVLLQPGNVSAIQVEDMAVVECFDEETALEKLIDICARMKRMESGVEFTCAAGIAL